MNPPNGSRLSYGADPVGATSIETTTEVVGAQTELLLRPGTVSFKRLLGGKLVQSGYMGRGLLSRA